MSYRNEYPRPQFVRNTWLNLNGEWQFAFDHGKSGIERELYKHGSFNEKIQVPFCPESKLSGIGYTDFMAAVWYKRSVRVPKGWLEQRTTLHFGAVDYHAHVWVNGKKAGEHKGGYTPFSFDITDLLDGEEATIVVYVEDDNRSGLQPRGKQSEGYYSAGCDYTRTTGIWQTVWMESVSSTYVTHAKFKTNPKDGSVAVELYLNQYDRDVTIDLEATFNGKIVAEETAIVAGQSVQSFLHLSEVHLWEPGQPNLYDVTITLKKEENVIDRVESYFGVRSVSIKNKVILINDKPIFQRLVLDQGFYPDGVYTAPTDEHLKKDIKISMDMGFNGARMHEKIFEPRYLYWADQLGYLVWGEHGNWGLDITGSKGLEQFLPEWMESIERDFNSPALIGWCPFNETWDRNGTRQNDQVLRITYEVTKRLDPTRPVIDTSGNFHVITDVFDIHDYEQNVEKFAAKFEEMSKGGNVYVTFEDRQQYENQPYFVSEYGGIWWNPDEKDGWGYGEKPQSEHEFIERYQGLTVTLLNNPSICAFCYTQLYDVEQEVNGLYTYQRKAKFDPSLIRKINSQKAAIEKDFAFAVNRSKE
ncbi:MULTISPECIES: glycoside hydrolase family 2 protein [Metabacillus]|nr:MULTISPECIES: sugar-binding domain-containing protein [Metabacillus]QNF30093.1 beta-galactosidase [Metabacillus sp. KUDC1714]